MTRSERKTVKMVKNDRQSRMTPVLEEDPKYRDSEIPADILLSP